MDDIFHELHADGRHDLCAVCSSQNWQPRGEVISDLSRRGRAYGASTSALTQQVSYRVQRLHSPGGTGPGPAVAVIVELLDAVGTNVSGPGITLTVTGVSPRARPGLAPGRTFTPVNLGLWPCYQLNVDTAGYPAGTYTLSFTVGTDPVTHAARFTVP